VSPTAACAWSGGDAATLATSAARRTNIRAGEVTPRRTAA
jgi:hypothetical protein